MIVRYVSGEDPFLGYTLVQPVVRGIQSQGVIANAKHYVMNNQVLRVHGCDATCTWARRYVCKGILSLCSLTVFSRRLSVPRSRRMWTSARDLRCTTRRSKAPSMLGRLSAIVTACHSQSLAFSTYLTYLGSRAVWARTCAATTRSTTCGAAKTTRPSAPTSR